MLCMSSSRVQLYATLWTIAHKAPLSMGFSRQEYWSVGCRVFFQGIFPTQGSNPHLLGLLHWQVGSLPPAPPGKKVIQQYYLVLKSKEVLPHATTWMNPEDILSEISHSQEDKYYISALIGDTYGMNGPYLNSSQRQKVKWCLPGGSKEWRVSLMSRELQVRTMTKFWDGKDGGDGCTTRWKHLMPLNCMLKWSKINVMYILSELKQNKTKQPSSIQVIISSFPP